ncbi:MAG: acyloxyacyl hydrolase [Rhodospirillaceae bacterium]|jgi:lipid A 3-O-deacylase|nr:acyloxyacyl hydrolase [Rhodospirillaceae bacterium]
MRVHAVPLAAPLAALSIVLGSLLAAPSQADDGKAHGILNEFKIGVLHHDTDNLWSGFRRESGADINLEAIFSPSYDVLSGTIRPAIGASINSSGNTSKVYGGLRWQYETAENLFFGIGLGAAVHNGDTDLKSNDTKALGSKLLFHIPLEAGYRFGGKHALSIYFDHISNAYTQDANEGLDTLGLRYGYRF